MQGDSGGALVSQNDKELVAVGIMSGGIGCGKPNIPGVYTNIPSYIKWINETISHWNEPSSRVKRQHWTGVDLPQRVSLLKRDVENDLPFEKFPVISQLRHLS